MFAFQLLYIVMAMNLANLFAVEEASTSFATTYLPVTLVNNSLTVSDDQLFVLIKGINPNTQRHCYIGFDPSSGYGTLLCLLL